MSVPNIPIALFRLGRVVATPNALEHLTAAEITQALKRHLAADWGEVSAEDRQANDRALEEGGRLFSVYHSTTGVKFWIISEASRARTTLLLPEDY
jgi:hypothetical protein